MIANALFMAVLAIVAARIVDRLTNKPVNDQVHTESKQ